jgi:hypothetical protein
MASTAILRTGTTNKAIYGLSVLVLVIGLRLASENTANLGYLVLAAYALFGRAQAIQALAMSWLITMINPGLAPESSLAAAGRYLVVFAAAGSVFTRSGFVSKPIVRPITALTLGLGGFFSRSLLVLQPDARHIGTESRLMDPARDHPGCGVDGLNTYRAA